ncbi:MAG TPA: diacylglycerol kinase family protein [Mycobacteriales bacterium]
MAAMRLHLVVNPHAGGGRARTVLPQYERLLARHDVVTTETRDLAHADVLAAEAIADGRTVVAVGGDGLTGRLAGAVSEQDGLLAVLPGGRGNDFARAMGIPADPEAAVTALESSVERRIDLGDANGTAFLCIASVGFDSDVQEFALRTRLPLGGQIYTVGTLRALLTWRHATFTVQVDGDPARMRGWSVVAANTSMYGGGMRIAPDAVPTDGMLDVVTTGASGRLRFLTNFPKIFAGTHTSLGEVSVVRTSRVLVDADRPFRVFADGDPIATLPCTVSVRPGALRVLAPSEPVATVSG